ncbi:MAG: ankyrin repeat domain-containing protein [Campylobacterota bacterium]|nr:ankyrin repeat domain-containing protein [Campylobacterota bacterium]
MQRVNIVSYIFTVMVFLGTLGFIANQSNRNELILTAVLQNNIEATKFLLTQNIDVNHKYKHNHTLLHSATLYGDINMVRLLVRNGAMLSSNDFGLTAMSGARDSNNSEIISFLTNSYNIEEK